MSGIQGTSEGPRSSAGADRAPDTREPVKNGLQKSTSVQAPTLSLPKGGGAISGIGEKFTANPVTGSAGMTVPIAVSQGRQGIAPQLALSYDSGTGNSPFGFGWSLSLPTIKRKTDKGLPRYEDKGLPRYEEAAKSDVFLLSDAEDLVPTFARDDDDKGKKGKFLVVDGAYKAYARTENLQVDGALHSFRVHQYRPRIEGLFARIERWTRDDGDVHWRSITKDNVLTLYGLDEWSRIADPQNRRRIFSWLISETRDDRGNAIVYSYKPEPGHPS